LRPEAQQQQQHNNNNNSSNTTTAAAQQDSINMTASPARCAAIHVGLDDVRMHYSLRTYPLSIGMAGYAVSKLQLQVALKGQNS
jgi:hypothetical protein